MPIESDALVREVAGDLAAQYPAARGIVFGPLPRLVSDAGLIRQAWANLLGNALEFSAKQASPQVRVSGEVVGDDVAFHVQDNGAGFDPAYAGRLFTMFQRLHAEADFTGSGIGLATVATVVHRHGGSIRAEGAVGRGATFHFVLPRKPARTAALPSKTPA